MKTKYCVVIILLLVALCILSACRYRIIDVVVEAQAEQEYEPQATPQPPLEELIPDDSKPPEPEPVEPDESDYQDEPLEPVEPEPEEPEPEESEPNEPEPEEPEPEELETFYEPPPEPAQQPHTPPDISDYAAAAIQISEPDTSSDAAPAYDTPAATPAATEASTIQDQPTITLETPSPYAAGDTTLDADGDGTLGLIIDRHTGLLSGGLGSLFECQRLYVYLEHLSDFQTVNRNSPLHGLIVDSGGFNAAARRGNDALTVDADWVVRQNPAVIIRTVTPDVLGANVTDTTRAAALRSELLERPGLESTTAVLDRRVLLLSAELLQTYEGQLLAKLYIANVMYPALFAETGIAQLKYEISAAGGTDFVRGLWAFSS